MSPDVKCLNLSVQRTLPVRLCGRKYSVNGKKKIRKSLFILILAFKTQLMTVEVRKTFARPKKRETWKTT